MNKHDSQCYLAWHMYNVCIYSHPSYLSRVERSSTWHQQYRTWSDIYRHIIVPHYSCHYISLYYYLSSHQCHHMTSIIISHTVLSQRLSTHNMTLVIISHAVSYYLKDYQHTTWHHCTCHTISYYNWQLPVCFQVAVNGKIINLMSGAVTGVSIAPCPHPCEGEPCMNGGQCKPHLDTYKCSCPLGYGNSNCEEGSLSVKYMGLHGSKK